MNESDFEWMQTLRFGDRLVGPQQQCYVIAEIGGNFNGEYDLATRSIDAAVDCGANAVKFQTYRADDFIADRDLTYTYREASGAVVTVSQFEMFKKMEFPHEWHQPIMEYAVDRGVHFLSSTADVDAVDLLVSLRVPALKIASEDIINLPVVERVAASGLPALVSTGMASEHEISNAMQIFESHKNLQVVLLQCTSRYPTPPEACNLNRMKSLQSRYGVPVGFSDHTEGWLAPTLAVAAGANVVEKHFTLDRTLPGPDHQMSMEPAAFKEMVSQIRVAETMMGKDGLDYDPSEESARTDYRRSIVANLPLKSGTVLEASMLAYRRPGVGMRPYERDKILGREINRDLRVNEIIRPEDVC